MLAFYLTLYYDAQKHKIKTCYTLFSSGSPKGRNSIAQASVLSIGYLAHPILPNEFVITWKAIPIRHLTSLRLSHILHETKEHKLHKSLLFHHTKECCGITLLFTYGPTMLAVTNSTASNGSIISK